MEMNYISVKVVATMRLVMTKIILTICFFKDQEKWGGKKQMEQ